MNAKKDGLVSTVNVLIIVITVLPAPIMANVSRDKMIIFVFATKDILEKHAILLAFVNQIRAYSCAFVRSWILDMCVLVQMGKAEVTVI